MGLLPESHNELEALVSEGDLWHPLLEKFKNEDLNDNVKGEWIRFGRLFLATRPLVSVQILETLLDRINESEIQKNTWMHKGEPLVWLSDAYLNAGYRWCAERILFLTLAEDIKDGRSFNPKDRNQGVLWRFQTYFGISHGTLEPEIQKLKTIKDYGNFNFFPEFRLLEARLNPMTSVPSQIEFFHFSHNKQLFRLLREEKSNLLDGRALEYLAAHLLSCVPGFKPELRVKTNETDFDVFTEIVGTQCDFRSDFGRFLICECKDKESNTSSFTDVAKLFSVLLASRCAVGVLFSPNGVSGDRSAGDEERFARRTILKANQSVQISLLVFNTNDLDRIGNGENFIYLLREKYIQTKHDLASVTIESSKPALTNSP